MKKSLTFDDVCLVPRFNDVPSRSEPDLSTYLTNKDKMGIPILASNMESVIGNDLAEVLLDHGSIPIMPRDHFTSITDAVYNSMHRFYVSWGVTDIDKLMGELNSVDWLGHPGVCLDVAHGHSIMMERAIKTIKDSYPETQVIAGAVCTDTAVWDLATWGADAIRVGIGPGAACTTRGVTGFGVPQFSALKRCVGAASDRKVHIIADGGIRNSGDVVKALAAGASSVMIGKLFAATDESAAEKRRFGQWMIDRGLPADSLEYLQKKCNEALYRGQASSKFQREGMVPEGEEAWIEVTGSAKDLLATLLGGIRSGMTYGGARTISEFHKKMSKEGAVTEVTPAYQTESRTRL